MGYQERDRTRQSWSANCNGRRAAVRIRRCCRSSRLYLQAIESARESPDDGGGDACRHWWICIRTGAPLAGDKDAGRTDCSGACKSARRRLDDVAARRSRSRWSASAVALAERMKAAKRDREH